MNFNSFLIKYAEIGVKGNNRYIFENTLCKKIREALSLLTKDKIYDKAPFHVKKENGRIYVYTYGIEDEDIINTLIKVFGISAVCPVLRVVDEGFENLCEKVCEYLSNMYTGEFSFKVEARRSRKSYPKDSMQINRDLGEYVLNHVKGCRVDVHMPDVLLKVEVRESAINIYSKEFAGPGGLPVSTNGKAMLLLSGGIDSPVAGYMTAKRGVEIDAVYFHAPPFTSERAKKKVVDLAEKLSVYAGSVNLYVVNFTEIQTAIYEKCPHEELTIIMRRYMMKIAEELAKRNGDMALVTGESIGQVASQTLQSLYVTNSVCSMPVLRPLIGMDKQEIVEESKKIGTYETSILPYEDCCTVFVSKHPVTKPVLKKIEISERKLDEISDSLLSDAIEGAELIKIR